MVYPGLSSTNDALQQFTIKAVQRHRGNQAEAEARERCGLWEPFFFESPSILSSKCVTTVQLASVPPVWDLQGGPLSYLKCEHLQPQPLWVGRSTAQPM